MGTDSGCMKACLVAIYLLLVYSDLININKLTLGGFYNVSLVGCLRSLQPVKLKTEVGKQF